MRNTEIRGLEPRFHEELLGIARNSHTRQLEYSLEDSNTAAAAEPAKGLLETRDILELLGPDFYKSDGSVSKIRTPPLSIYLDPPTKVIDVARRMLGILERVLSHANQTGDTYQQLTFPKNRQILKRKKITRLDLR